jgi:hypothetical protein
MVGAGAQDAVRHLKTVLVEPWWKHDKPEMLAPWCERVPLDLWRGSAVKGGTVSTQWRATWDEIVVNSCQNLFQQQTKKIQQC